MNFLATISAAVIFTIIFDYVLIAQHADYVGAFIFTVIMFTGLDYIIGKKD